MMFQGMSPARRVAMGFAILAIACLGEYFLYWHRQYFRPESQHFSWLRVLSVCVTTAVVIVSAEWIRHCSRLDRNGRFGVAQSLWFSWPYIVYWVVADQGVSGWDVVGRTIFLAIFFGSIASAKPSWLGIRGLPKES